MRRNKPAYPPPRSSPCTNRAGRSRGYTLIELMIVVTVLSILTALAVPSYLNYVTESHRSEATIGLTTMAARQELYFSNYGRYTDKVADLGYRHVAGRPEAAFSSDERLWILQTTINRTGVFGFTPCNNCYQLIAEAFQGASLKDTECGRIKLDSYGRRQATDLIGQRTDKCWN